MAMPIESSTVTRVPTVGSPMTAPGCGYQGQERRVLRHERLLEPQWGKARLGRATKFFADEPPSSRRWSDRSEGERAFGAWLNRDLGDVGVVLHDRLVPDTNGAIDHLVVAATGVWIIDTDGDDGRVERRDVGGWMHDDHHLFVGDRDRTEHVRAMGWQTDAVERIIEPLGIGALPLHRVLCFTEADWSWFARPFDIDEVLVCWPKKLVSMISDTGPFSPDAIDLVAMQLGHELRAR